VLLGIPYRMLIKLLPAIFVGSGWTAEFISIGLLIPISYYLSVWIENGVIAKFLHNKYDKETIMQAVKSANRASYKFLFVIYLIMAFGALVSLYNAHMRSQETQNIEDIEGVA
jgi:hypothetical protein